jgi:hypothetical protein
VYLGKRAVSIQITQDVLELVDSVLTNVCYSLKFLATDFIERFRQTRIERLPVWLEDFLKYLFQLVYGLTYGRTPAEPISNRLIQIWKYDIVPVIKKLIHKF